MTQKCMGPDIWQIEKLVRIAVPDILWNSLHEHWRELSDKIMSLYLTVT